MSTPDQGRRIIRGSRWRPPKPLVTRCRYHGCREMPICAILSMRVVRLTPRRAAALRRPPTTLCVSRRVLRIRSWLASASVQPRWDRREPWSAPCAVKTVGGIKTRLIPLGTAVDWTMLVPIDLAPGPMPAIPLRHGREGCGLDHDIVADA